MRNNITLKGPNDMEYLLIFLVTSMLFGPLKYKYLTYRDKTFAFLFFVLPCFIILVLFIGLRNNVGVDFKLYYNMFHLGWGQEKELGYRLINDTFKQFNFPFNSLLVFIAALSIYFVFILIKKQAKYKVFSFTLFWLDGGIFYLFNVIRQGVTNFIFLNILGMIRDKKYLIIILLITLGVLFHYSIILALFFIPFILKKYSKITLLILYFSSIIIMLSIDLPTIFITFLKVIPHFGEIYLQENLLKSLVLRRDFGLGYLFRFILVFILILFYDKIFIQDSKILPYLNAFIFWGIFKILTLDIWIFERVLDYLRYSSIIVVPHIITIADNKYLRYFIGILIFVIYFILFLKSSIFSGEEERLIPYKWIFS